MTKPTEKLTWKHLENKGLLEKYGDEYYFTDRMAETIKAGEDWINYYKGEHTVIRKDKLALLMKDRETLRQIQNPTTGILETPKHCSKCGNPLKIMPCDEELTYCPECDIPQEY